METLPIEAVESITQYLTPQDLARCCEVSVDWREVFNEDCLWKPHCDLTLEEHLRTTPPVVHPVLETPAANDSTLIPVSQWRMAFLREKRLKNNWKHGNYREEIVLQLSGKDIIDFLTSNHVVRWCSDRIELWDVSSVPATMVALTDLIIYKEFPNRSNCFAVGAGILVYVGESVIQVFDVDTVSGYIGLKLKIFVGEEDKDLADSILKKIRDIRVLFREYGKYENVKKCIVRDNKLMHINKSGSRFRVFDLNTGLKLKEEPCPVSGNGNELTKFAEMISSENSDNIIVVVESMPEFAFFDPVEEFNRLYLGHPRDKGNYHYFIYSPTQLLFLPFTTKSKDPYFDCAINGDFVALSNNLESFTVYNYRTSDLCLTVPGWWSSRLTVFKDCFIYKERETLILLNPSDKHEVRVSPSHDSMCSFRITKNKYVTCIGEYGRDKFVSVWESNGRSLKQCDIIIVGDDWKMNQEFTKAVHASMHTQYVRVFHYW